MFSRKRIIRELISRYRSSDSDSIEQIGGLEGPVPPSPMNAPPKKAAHLYDDEQLEDALELLSINSLPELSRQDFSSFGKKQSWIQLATGCTQRLATDLLRLNSIGEVAERVDLLHNRLEARKAARIRTPNEAQKDIANLYATSRALRDLHRLGTGGAVDVEFVIGRAQSIMGSWRAVTAIAPNVDARTYEMGAIVRSALHRVLTGASSDRVKDMARRALLQWGEAAPSASTAMVRRGEKIDWDSD